MSRALDSRVYYSRRVTWERRGAKVERVERVFNANGNCIRSRTLPINDRPRDWSTVPNGGSHTYFKEVPDGSSSKLVVDYVARYIAKRDWLERQGYLVPERAADRGGEHQWCADYRWHANAYPNQYDRTGFWESDEEGYTFFVPYTGRFTVTNPFIAEIIYA